MLSGHRSTSTGAVVVLGAPPHKGSFLAATAASSVPPVAATDRTGPWRARGALERSRACRLITQRRPPLLGRVEEGGAISVCRRERHAAELDDAPHPSEVVSSAYKSAVTLRFPPSSSASMSGIRDGEIRLRKGRLGCPRATSCFLERGRRRTYGPFDCVPTRFVRQKTADFRAPSSYFSLYW